MLLFVWQPLVCAQSERTLRHSKFFTSLWSSDFTRWLKLCANLHSFIVTRKAMAATFCWCRNVKKNTPQNSTSMSTLCTEMWRKRREASASLFLWIQQTDTIQSTFPLWLFLCLLWQNILYCYQKLPPKQRWHSICSVLCTLHLAWPFCTPWENPKTLVSSWRRHSSVHGCQHCNIPFEIHHKLECKWK